MLDKVSPTLLEKFLAGQKVTVPVEKDVWLGVLSWLVPAKAIVQVKESGHYYNVTLQLDPASKRRWGLD